MNHMKPIDRVQALKHSKNYTDDYRIYSERYAKDCASDIDTIIAFPTHPDAKKKLAAFISAAAVQLCTKYNLRFPISPEDPYHESDLLRIPSSIEFFSPREFLLKLKRVLPDEMILKITRELGNYLNGRIGVMFDPTYPQDHLIKEFGWLVKESVSRATNKMTESDIDIWKVYDLRETERMKFTDIAQRLLGRGKNPAYDKFACVNVAKIRRAYLKAKSFIQDVDMMAKVRKD